MHHINQYLINYLIYILLGPKQFSFEVITVKEEPLSDNEVDEIVLGEECRFCKTDYPSEKVINN